MKSLKENLHRIAENVALVVAILLMILLIPLGSYLAYKMYFKEPSKKEQAMKEIEEQISELEPPAEIINITLKAIQDSFNLSPARKYAMGQKYVGATLCITGRASGVSEEGILRLQVESGDETIGCFGISDPEFLASIKNGDIVAITGTLRREKSYFVGNVCALRDCIDWKKVNK